MARGFGQYGAQHRTIAQVQMPIIRAAKGQGVCHAPCATKFPQPCQELSALSVGVHPAALAAASFVSVTL